MTIRSPSHSIPLLLAGYLIALLGSPLVLAHGEEDDVVVMERGTAARDALTALGYAVDWHSYPMGHSVCAEEVADLNAFLLRVLAPD